MAIDLELYFLVEVFEKSLELPATPLGCQHCVSAGTTWECKHRWGGHVSVMRGWVDMCLDMCTGACRDMCMNMCNGIWMDMCADMCMYT